MNNKPNLRLKILTIHGGPALTTYFLLIQADKELMSKLGIRGIFTCLIRVLLE
jgi:hypothetical protein